MERRISQETFDTAVKENMEEFDMPLAEAISDALQQFRGQGVDLTNIDTSGGEGKVEIMAAISAVNAYVKDRSTSTVVDICQHLEALASQCDDKNSLSRRNQTLVLTEDCYNSLHYLLEEKYGDVVITRSLQLLGVICKSNVECRDFFEPGGSAKLSSLLRTRLESWITDTSAMDITGQVLKTARIVSKSENNKVALMKNGFGDYIIQILGSINLDSSPHTHNIIREACMLIRGLCVHDDNRKETSCAYDNGRLLVGSTEVPQALMQAAARFIDYPAVAIAALGAARALITADDAVRAMCQHGALALPSAILRYPEASQSLIKAALGLTRNLCADDIRKDTLVGDGTLAMVIRVLNTDPYDGDAGLVEHGIASLAAMSLRSPSNSSRMMSYGVATVLVKCMRKHSLRPALLRQACLTVRNIAARCPDLRESLLDAGMETVLRDAGGRFREVVDEAYAALRDLGCDAKVVSVDESLGGVTVQEAFQQFGVGKKAQFNPVFEETADIVFRVASEAKAPFPRNRLDADDDSDEDAAITAVDVSLNDEHKHDHEHSVECCDRHDGDACVPAGSHEHDHAHSH